MMTRGGGALLGGDGDRLEKEDLAKVAILGRMGSGGE